MPDVSNLRGMPVESTAARDRLRWAEANLRDGPPWHAKHAVYLGIKGGLVWQEDGDLEQAAGLLHAAVHADPYLPEAATLLSGVLAEMGCHDDALAVAEAALERVPGHRGLADRVSSLLLSRECWTQGWAVWPRAIVGADRRLALWLAGIPHWDGSPLDGRTLALYPHPRCAGDGDLLMFARYTPLIEGGQVLIVAPRPLHRLFEHSFRPARAVLPADAAHADVWCLSVEMPLVLPGMDGPPPGNPYVRPPADRVTEWRAWRRLNLQADTLNVGLVWAAGHTEDLPRGTERSIPACLLAPLARVPGVRWLSLQKGPNERDAAPDGMHLERLGPSFSDFADTAAVVSALDLVITCDTSVANLAGAMGATTWVLLPTASDWRWGKGAISPWYPSAHLFRQRTPGDWAPVIEDVAVELRRLIETRHVTGRAPSRA